ncbi:zf-MYND and TPR domain-containing protein [Skeletonema marinoi]|uniref:Zf-MYND and TPR domain-containing protein n=1 Tax=Skeletonema marinoi TaxID=267567 RepID=A0AAD8XU61_9STRA|nr:zf-MYND and TPR domain-containing protein [Skeletonema marinoi]
MCCAYCGIAEGDDIKLKTCTACKSARYCSVKCQKEHRSKHKQECKKRAAELHDELLFKQPESTHYGDCPICCLPLLLDEHKSLIEGDYDTAFEYWTKATGLGDVGAHFNLSRLYRKGLGVEKDKKKRLHHLEAAAIGGDHVARNHLAIVEWENGRQERAIKHWIIAATLGDDDAVTCLREWYVVGLVCKEDAAAALRAYQAAVDATKSAQREAATMRFVPICLAKAARLVSHEGGGRCRSRGHGIEKDRIESSLRGSGNIFVWIRPPNDGIVCSITKSSGQIRHITLLILEYSSLPLPRSITFCN